MTECCARSKIVWDGEEMVKGYTEKMWEIHRRLDEEEEEEEATARQMAAGRAMWEAVVGDPIARFLAGPTHLRRFAATAAPTAAPPPRRGLILAARTLWFDARISDAIARFKSSSSSRSSTVQVVLLGAGMDARAYRLDCLAGCHVYEVDLPRVVEAKEALMGEVPEGGGATAAAAAKVARVAADLAAEGWWEKLSDAGFKAGHAAAVATLWVAEGLLYYLREAAADALLRRIACSGTPLLLLADILHAEEGVVPSPPPTAAGMAVPPPMPFSASTSATIRTTLHHPTRFFPQLGFDAAHVRVSQLGDPDTLFEHILGAEATHFLGNGRLPPSPRLLLLQCSTSAPTP